MATIRKFRNKWRAEVRRQGHAHMSKVFPTKGEASRWARETERALETGDLHNLSNKTMGDMIDAYLEENPDAITYEVSTLKQWRELLGKVKLNQVRRKHVKDAREKLAQQIVKSGSRKGETLSNATINRRVALLARVCRIAIEDWDWLKDNPAHIRALPEDNERDRILSPDERVRLLEAVVNHPEKALLGFVLVAEATGMRAGELRALKWADVDIDEGLLRILKSKNRDKRVVAVTGEALDWLKQWRKDTELRFGGYVFGNMTGHAPFYYSKAFPEVRDAAGLEDFRFHDLRHGFVTAALTSNVNPILLSKVSGHRSTYVMQRYATLLTDVAKDVARTVEGRRSDKG